jgi:hypothetical protein
MHCCLTSLQRRYGLLWLAQYLLYVSWDLYYQLTSLAFELPTVAEEFWHQVEDLLEGLNGKGPPG